jgi:hypothetical protein
MTPWWSNETAGWIGGVVGTTCGLFGAVLGVLMGTFGQRGRFKGLVNTISAIWFLGGVGALVAGLYALAIHQPYAVWYPLVLVGGLSTLLIGTLWPTVVRNVYRQAEIRRLEAEELRRS